MSALRSSDKNFGSRQAASRRTADFRQVVETADKTDLIGAARALLHHLENTRTFKTAAKTAADDGSDDSQASRNSPQILAPNGQEVAGLAHESALRPDGVADPEPNEPDEPDEPDALFSLDEIARRIHTFEEELGGEDVDAEVFSPGVASNARPAQPQTHEPAAVNATADPLIEAHTPPPPPPPPQSQDAPEPNRSPLTFDTNEDSENVPSISDHFDAILDELEELLAEIDTRRARIARDKPLQARAPAKPNRDPLCVSQVALSANARPFRDSKMKTQRHTAQGAKVRSGPNEADKSTEDGRSATAAAEAALTAHRWDALRVPKPPLSPPTQETRAKASVQTPVGMDDDAASDTEQVSLAQSRAVLSDIARILEQHLKSIKVSKSTPSAGSRTLPRSNALQAQQALAPEPTHAPVRHEDLKQLDARLGALSERMHAIVRRARIEMQAYLRHKMAVRAHERSRKPDLSTPVRPLPPVSTQESAEAPNDTLLRSMWEIEQRQRELSLASNFPGSSAPDVAARRVSSVAGLAALEQSPSTRDLGPRPHVTQSYAPRNYGPQPYAFFPSADTLPQSGGSDTAYDTLSADKQRPEISRFRIGEHTPQTL